MWNILFLVFLSSQRVQPITTFEEYHEASHLTESLALIEFTSDQASNIDLSLMNDISRKLKHYSKFYTANCDDLKNRVPECNDKNITKLPIYTLYIPPPLEINPYTKEEMKHTQVSIGEGNAKESTIEALILDRVPDLVINLRDGELAQLEEMKFMNKLISFSTNDRPTPMLKLLSYKLKQRILVCFISSSNKEIAKKYGVTSFPSVVAIQSYDFLNNKYTSSDEVVKFTGEINFDSIFDFALRFASEKPMSEEEMSSKLKEIKERELKKITQPIKAVKENITDLINNVKGALIYIDDGAADSTLLELSQAAWPLCNMYLISPSLIVDTPLSKYKPSSSKLYYLPVGYKGESKLNRVSSLPTSVKSSSLLEEIYDSINDNSKKLISEQEFQQRIADDFMSKGKSFIALYFHNDKEISPIYQVLSSDPDFNEIDFTTYFDPPEKMLSAFNLKGNQLPATVLIQKPENISKGQYKMNIFPSFAFKDYSSISKEILSMINIKQEEPMSKIDQTETEELTSANIDKLCYQYKGLCIIGFLQASMLSNADKAKYENQIAILNDVLSIKKPIAIRSMYVNGSCHTSFAKALGVDTTFLPTFVVLYPAKK